jgi:uncharacterized protein YkwD
MAGADTMAHQGIGDGDLAARAAAVGYPLGLIEENVAVGPPDLPAVMSAWVSSPGHWANLMNARVTDFGGAVAYDGHGVPFWCTVFGRPLG